MRWKKTWSYSRFLKDCQRCNKSSVDWDAPTSGGFYVECGMNIRPWSCSSAEAWTAWHHFLFVFYFIHFSFFLLLFLSILFYFFYIAALPRARKEHHFLLLRTLLLRLQVRFNEFLPSVDVFTSFQGCFTSCWGRTLHFLLRRDASLPVEDSALLLHDSSASFWGNVTSFWDISASL